MRTVLSILLAALAGVLASLSLVGARAEALVHTPEPLQRIAGPMSEDPELRAALTTQLGEVVRDELPEGLPEFLQSGVTRLVQGAVGGMATDERFPAAWSETVERTRTDWAARMDRLATQGPTPAGTSGADAADGAGGQAESATVHLQTAPLLDLGIDRLVDSVSGLPGGRAAAEALRQEQDRLDGAASEPDAAVLTVDLAMDLSVPDPQSVDLDAVAWTVDHLHRWPWLAGSSAVLALLALLIAPRRRRCAPLFAAGVTVLAVGAAARWGMGRMAPATDLDGIAQAAAGSLLEGVRDYAMPDTSVLIVGGGIIAAVGLVTALVSGLRSRPDRAPRSGVTDR